MNGNLMKGIGTIIPTRMNIWQRTGVFFAATLLSFFIVSSHSASMRNMAIGNEHASMASASANPECTVACTGVSLQKVTLNPQPPIQEKEPIPPEILTPITFVSLSVTLILAIYSMQRGTNLPLFKLHSSLRFYL